MTDQSADKDFIIHGSAPSLEACHGVFSSFLLNIECSVPGATGSLEVQLDCAQFQKLHMVRGAVFKEAPSNSIYISGSCSVDAPSEPQ